MVNWTDFYTTSFAAERELPKQPFERRPAYWDRCYDSLNVQSPIVRSQTQPEKTERHITLKRKHFFADHFAKIRKLGLKSRQPKPLKQNYGIYGDDQDSDDDDDHPIYGENKEFTRKIIGFDEKLQYMKRYNKV